MAWIADVPDSSHSITADLNAMRENFTEANIRLRSLEDKFDKVAGHIHDGSDDDAPKINWYDLADPPRIYTPEAATADKLGCIKVGAGLNMSEEGVCSVEGSGKARFERFTENKNFTVPPGISRVYVTMVGGGGASGAGSSYQGQYPSQILYSNGGSGGGGAFVIKHEVSVQPVEVIPIIVGVGGSNSDGSHATAGSPSSFGSYLSVSGGGAGGNASGSTAGTSGTGGSCTGQGGDTPWGYVGSPSTAIAKGFGFGTGGRGGSGKGSPGNSGMVLIEW